MTALLVACLISLPSVCRTQEFILHETMPVSQFLEAQQMAAEWLARHPDMISRGVTIRPGRSA